MLRYNDLNANEKRIYDFLSNKPEGSDIHELYHEFDDMDMSKVQAIIKRFNDSGMLKDTQGAREKGDCPWLFTLKRSHWG